MTTALRCGRLDDHDAHDWNSLDRTTTYTCRGRVVTEGAALVKALDHLPADPFVAPGQHETPDDVFAVTTEPKPVSATVARERERARLVAQGFGRNHAAPEESTP